MVLGGDVEVLRKGTAGDEACTFLKYRQCAKVRRGDLPKHADPSHVQVQGSRRGPGACQSVVGCVDQNREQDQESEATVPRTPERVPDLRKGEIARTAGCPRRRFSCCYLVG